MYGDVEMEEMKVNKEKDTREQNIKFSEGQPTLAFIRKLEFLQYVHLFHF